MAKTSEPHKAGNSPGQGFGVVEQETQCKPRAAAVPAISKNGVTVDARNGIEMESGTGVEGESGIRVETESGIRVETESVTEVERESRSGVEAESGCGWHFCLSGSCVRHSRTAKWLLFWMCCAVFTLSMMVNGFMNVNVTTLEKRFKLKSKSSGLIISSWDIGSVSLVAPLSYIGSRPGTSKSRLLGTCVIIAGLGCYMAMLPHFLVPPYRAPRTNDSIPEDHNLCRPQSSLQSRDFEVPVENPDAPHLGTYKMSNFLYVFIFASYITGLFSSPVFPVGASFIDECVSPDKSAFYLGILLTAATVGPPVGFGLGGQLLKVFIDAPAFPPAHDSLTPSSDRWLGAWWIGYAITGTLSLLVGFNILMIPSSIPRPQPSQELQLSQEREIRNSVKYASKHMNPVRQRHSVVVLRSQPSPYHYLAEFLRASRTLVCNVPFVLLSLAKAGETFIFAGIVPFMPKFMETQYGISADLAAMSMGLFGLLGGAAGTFVGGWLMTHLKMSCKSALRFCFLISLTCVLSGAVFLIRCPNKTFAGVTTGYTNFIVMKSPNITSSCNAGCSCSNVPFSPVCGANNVIYFSPCHAGCTRSNKHNDQEIFSDCACVDVLRQPSAVAALHDITKLRPDQAVNNGCPSDCGLFGFFVSAHLILVFLSVLTAMPYINVTMRCVAYDLRAYAIGLQGLPMCLLGTVPGPIVFGAVVDMACLVWSEPDTGKGACAVYNNVAFGSHMFILALTVKIAVVACLFIAWRWYDEKSAKESTMVESTEASNEERLCKCEPTSASPPKSKQSNNGDLVERTALESHSGHNNVAFTDS